MVEQTDVCLCIARHQYSQRVLFIFCFAAIHIAQMSGEHISMRTFLLCFALNETHFETFSLLECRIFLTVIDVAISHIYSQHAIFDKPFVESFSIRSGSLAN